MTEGPEKAAQPAQATLEVGQQEIEVPVGVISVGLMLKVGLLAHKSIKGPSHSVSVPTVCDLKRSTSFFNMIVLKLSDLKTGDQKFTLRNQERS